MSVGIPGLNASMASCPHSEIVPSLDRWQECHWHLHQMEANYHEPDAFRYAFNSFIRAAKEVPIMLAANLQHLPSVRAAIATQREKLKKNALFATLQEQRDFVVHHGMLDLRSRGSVCTIEGRKIKFSFPFPVYPHEASDDAYERFKEICRTDKFWGGMGPDCDSAPAIWRTWMIKEFSERDLLEIAFEAWTLMGEVLSDTIVALKGEPLDLSMPCRHDPEAIKVKRFSQQEFFLSVDGIDLQEEERKRGEQATEGRG